MALRKLVRHEKPCSRVFNSSRSFRLGYIWPLVRVSAVLMDPAVVDGLSF